ncbi:MAG: hypothetical protein QFX33_02985 [Candidatus Nezhaarchaeota archaeon]|nr:hypothetical protein [Candidatus Nezhaarchaeota archaeon]
MGRLKRKVLAASRDLVDKLEGIVRNKGLTMYSYINRLISIALKAESLGLTVEKMVEEYVAQSSAKAAGMILAPVSDVSPNNVDEWDSMGERMALLTSIRGLKGWRALEALLYALFDGVAKVSIQVFEGERRIVVLGQNLTEDILKAYSRLIEGAARTLSLKVNISSLRGCLIVNERLDELEKAGEEELETTFTPL